MIGPKAGKLLIVMKNFMLIDNDEQLLAMRIQQYAGEINSFSVLK